MWCMFITEADWLHLQVIVFIESHIGQLLGGRGESLDMTMKTLTYASGWAITSPVG